MNRKPRLSDHRRQNSFRLCCIMKIWGGALRRLTNALLRRKRRPAPRRIPISATRCPAWPARSGRPSRAPQCICGCPIWDFLCVSAPV
eukprot:5859151-Prymnesium_polylepis.1